MQAESQREVLFSGELKELMLISHIVLANNLVTDRFVRQRYNMPVQAWSSLYTISIFPGVRAKNIADLLPRPQNTISRAIVLLEERGLIRSVVPDHDGREKALFITPAGSDLLTSQIETVRLRQEEMLSPLTQDDRKILVEILRKMTRHPALRVSAAMSLNDK